MSGLVVYEGAMEAATIGSEVIGEMRSSIAAARAGVREVGQFVNETNQVLNNAYGTYVGIKAGVKEVRDDIKRVLDDEFKFMPHRKRARLMDRVDRQVNKKIRSIENNPRKAGTILNKHAKSSEKARLGFIQGGLGDRRAYGGASSIRRRSRRRYKKKKKM